MKYLTNKQQNRMEIWWVRLLPKAGVVSRC